MINSMELPLQRLQGLLLLLLLLLEFRKEHRLQTPLALLFNLAKHGLDILWLLLLLKFSQALAKNSLFCASFFFTTLLHSTCKFLPVVSTPPFNQLAYLSLMFRPFFTNHRYPSIY